MSQAFPSARQAFGGSYSQAREDWALYEQFHEHWSRDFRGVFVEMGALDGVSHSNSLAYERWLNWTGVLIEANPSSCAELFERRRSGATVNLCTAIANSTTRSVTFEQGAYQATFAAKDAMSASYRAHWHTSGAKARREVVVPAQPLGRLLRMVGVAKVDAFFLDVEGSELQVLRTFDWSLPVHVWCIEVQSETAAATRALLASHGYTRTPWRYASRIKLLRRRELLLQSELFVRDGAWSDERYSWAPESPWTQPPKWARDRAARARRQALREPYPAPAADSLRSGDAPRTYGLR